MPRTTIDLDSGVLAELRARASSEGKSMGRVASEQLALALNQDSGPSRSDFEWTTWDLGAPKVDLDDKEALRRALDEDAGRG